MKEIIFLPTIRLSESINLNVINLIQLHLLEMFCGIKCDQVRTNVNDITRDARYMRRYVFG